MFCRIFKLDSEHVGVKKLGLAELPDNVLECMVQASEELGVQAMGNCFGVEVKGNAVEFVEATRISKAVGNMVDSVVIYLCVPDKGYDRLLERAVWKRGGENG